MGTLTTDLAHVRWIAGGTGAGKSTVARIPAHRFGLSIYDGDLAEHGWVARCTVERAPHMWAGLRRGLEESALRTPEEKFNGMASLHGETIGFVVEDLLATSTDRPVLVDYFGVAPRDLVPLLGWAEQAVFLLPTTEFRRCALGNRYADPDRARANWGDSDHAQALANRLARDDLWDAELRRQASDTGLSVIGIDGTRTAADLADELARRFRLSAG